MEECPHCNYKIWDGENLRNTPEYTHYGNFFVSESHMVRGDAFDKDIKYLLGCPKCGMIFMGGSCY